MGRIDAAYRRACWKIGITTAVVIALWLGICWGVR